jgi:hypothetical protein
MAVGLSRELQIETSRRGYWAGIGLVVASVGIAAVMFWSIYRAVVAMPRTDARGEHVVNLPAGDVVVFAEQPDGVADISARCAATDASGSALALVSMGSTSISYDVGSYHGQSMFDLEVRANGPVTITCETDADFVLAFGEGIGKTIAIGGVLALLTFLSGCFIVGRTFVRRRRERRRVTDDARTKIES